MKYLFVLFLGIAIGISGELLIPKSYRYGQTTGCLKDGPYVFIPTGKLYDPKRDKRPFDVFVNHGFIPSYKFAYYLYTGRLSWMSMEECSKVQDLSVDRD